jgi:hypothetical protein
MEWLWLYYATTKWPASERYGIYQDPMDKRHAYFSMQGVTVGKKQSTNYDKVVILGTWIP